jgi:hypothetical protein
MFREIVATIRTKLEAEWSGAPIAWPNEDFQANGQDAWVHVEVQGNGAEGTVIGSVGKRAVTEMGLIFAHVFVPVGTGTDEAFRIAEEIGAVFRLTSFSGTGVRIAAGVPSIGEAEPGDENGNWFRVSASIPFTAHYSV